MAKQLSVYFISLVRDACLKAFWRKSTLASFLRQNHIVEQYIPPLFNGETKAKVLADIFDRLSQNQTEKHQAAILDMARELSIMETFPDLCVCDDSILKIKAAKEAIAVLRNALEKLEATYISTGNEELKKKAKEKREACISFESQFQMFSKRLHQLAARAGQQSAGYDFEEWIYEFSAFNDIEVRSPYKDTSGRQIDGALTIDGDTLLIEAKCTACPINVEDIDSFRAKIQTKADNTLGLMISMSGYSQGAIQAASQGRIPFVLIDGLHLFNIVMTRMASFKRLYLE